ncbi:hypothetical protein H5410_014949 [Solanum commersonii]|uniref:Uncharacterized protein n=1 Tax=Solanum commersonii TaxID=4109 RepID=A0A9J5ZS86_SOLCO|nr:hypothetical protein H5410_014949 [Solanum commersonii]
MQRDNVENAKQVSLMECTNLLDKVNSKITEQIFECTEGHKAIMKFLYELDGIQLEITTLVELEEIATQQRQSYEEARDSESILATRTNLISKVS